MTSYEKFSVAMCVYGGDTPAYFRDAVTSVEDQTVRPSEIVIVVDGPVPAELNAVISEFEADPLFQIVRLPENLGHGNARRKSLECCSFDLVALMDADDLSLPDRFEKELELFTEHPEVSAVSGQISEFADHSGQIVGHRIIPCSDTELKEYMKTRCPLNQVAVMLRKSDVQSVGGYLDWYCDEDYYLWIRMALAGMKFAASSDVLVNVRVGTEMYQRRGGWKYFCSERRLQKLMRQKKMISFPLYVSNVIKRLIVQVLLPNRLRSWVFKHFARE